MVVRSLLEQVRDEQEAKGWSVQQLLEKSGLDLDRSTLHRKLNGDVDVKAHEIEALAKALDLGLTMARKSRRKRKRLA